MEASMRVTTVCLILVVLTLGSALTFAQGSGTCTVTGTVYDTSGAVVPGAKVQLVQQTTNSVRETVANSGGFFSFIGVPPTTYDVKVSLKGFAPFAQKGLTLHINDQVDLRQIVLKVAASDTKLEVTAEPTEVIPVSSGDTSYTLTNTQVDNLAIIGRNAVELVKILPGAQNSGGWNGKYDPQTTGFNSGAGAYTVNGTRFDQMAMVSDGGNVIDPGFNGGAMVTPNVEMIQEAKVETGSFSAENPNGPIVMSTITKSGGKDFHGSAYYSVRDGSMNANDWQNNHNGIAKPASRYQYPGFTIGGPVLIPGTSFNKDHDKLFFFAGVEWMRQGVDLGLHKAVVPTKEMLAGDFTGAGSLYGLVGNRICQNTYANYCASDGKILPSAIDPVGLLLLKQYPQANADPAKSGGFNYLTDIVNPQNRAQQLLKIDYAVSANTHFSGRYNHEGETIPFPYGLWQTWPTNPYPGGVVGSDNSHSIALNFTHAFSSTLTTDTTFTMGRLFYGNHLTTPDKVSASKLGYPYYGVYNNGLDLIPNIGGDVASTGVADIFNEGGVVPSQNTPKWTYTFSQNMAKAIGSHLIKAGFYWSRATWLQRTGDNSYLDQGAITLASWNSWTGEHTDPSLNASPNPYADLLMGHISMFSQGIKSVQLNFAANEYDFYALDDWKIGRRLTINYGARIDHMGWWYNKEGNIAVFDPSKYDPNAAISAYTGIVTNATDPSVSKSGFKPVGLQFAPSVGFSWDVAGTGKTVVRGGFGVNYFRDEAITAAFKLVQNPPLQSMDFFSWSGLTLSGLSSISPSATQPWLNVAMASEGQMPRTYSYNLTVQRQLPGSTLLSAAYVGNSSQHLVGWPDANPIPEGSAEMGNPWPGQWQDTSVASRPYKNIAGIYPAAHILRSNYNSFQLTASRGKGAINYWASYTWSKGLGNTYADSFDQSRSYGPLPWDRSQALKFAYNVTLPNFSKKYLGNHPALNGAIDGWQISGITEFSSGGPVSVIASSFPGGYNIGMNGVSGVSDLSARYIVGTPDGNAVPVLVCDPTANLKPQQIFNGACFQSPTPGHNGSYRIPYIHGPWYNNSDLSVFKNFKITESKKLQFRAEAFNFLNHALWGFNPSGTSYNDAALNLTYASLGSTPTNASSAGVMTQKFGHRTIQLALKFYF
jgi:hypothetical protein